MFSDVPDTDQGRDFLICACVVSSWSERARYNLRYLLSRIADLSELEPLVTVLAPGHVLFRTSGKPASAQAAANV